MQESVRKEVDNKYISVSNVKHLLHDLSNPLTLVQINLDRVLEDLQEEERQQLVTMLERAMEGLDQVNKMILTTKHELLQQEVISSFSAVEELNRLVNLFKLRFDFAGILVEEDYEDDRMFIGNLSVFQRIYSNLILNAVECLERSDRQMKCIRISTTRSVESFKITISDNGPPINDDMKDRLFLQGYSTKQKGRGMGLSFVRNALINYFHANVLVKNLRKGKSFRTEFPCK